MKFVILISLISYGFAGTIQAPAVTLVNTGRSAQYRSQDNLGNYAFGYDEEHLEGGSFRRESGNAYGQVVGSYGLRGADGRLRIVNYVADDDGFRADIKTNEPGVEPKDSASASVNKPSVSVVTQAVAPASASIQTIIDQASVQPLTALPSQAIAAARAKTIIPAAQVVAAPVVAKTISAVPVKGTILSPASAAKVISQTSYGSAVNHAAPIVQAPIVQESKGPITQVHEQMIESPIIQTPAVKAPIVQAPVVQEAVVQEPIVQASIVKAPIEQAPVVQEAVVQEPIVQAPILKAPIEQAPVQEQIISSTPPVKSIIQAPIYQQSIDQAQYTAPLPIAKFKAPLQYVAPISANVKTLPLASKFASTFPAVIHKPVAQVHYAEPISQIYESEPIQKIVQAPQLIQQVTYQPSTLVKSSPSLVTADQSELELTHTYAHPAAYGYTLGMPSSFGYTYVLRKKK